MKHYLFFFAILLAGCNSVTTPKPDSDYSSVPELQLPFKIRCFGFPYMENYYNTKASPLPDSPSYFGKIVKGNVTVLIRNVRYSHTPVLLTLDKNGKLVDMLELFDKDCYQGVDSHYLPWIEIDTNLTVTRTDTSYYTHDIEMADDPKTKTILEFKSSPDDTVITNDIFKIDSVGKITRVK